MIGIHILGRINMAKLDRSLLSGRWLTGRFISCIFLCRLGLRAFSGAAA